MISLRNVGLFWLRRLHFTYTIFLNFPRLFFPIFPGSERYIWWISAMQRIVGILYRFNNASNSFFPNNHLQSKIYHRSSVWISLHNQLTVTYYNHQIIWKRLCFYREKSVGFIYNHPKYFWNDFITANDINQLNLWNNTCKAWIEFFY